MLIVNLQAFAVYLFTDSAEEASLDLDGDGFAVVWTNVGRTQ